MIPSRETSDVPNVSALLHTLRGEAFRHRRNLLGVRPHTPASPSAQGPSLPPLFTNHIDPDDSTQISSAVPSHPATKFAGPSPPRSWTTSTPSSTPSVILEWGARALSLVLQHSPALAEPTNPHIPSLFQICLHNLHKWGGIPPELFPELPRHILREYVRYCVLHSFGIRWVDLKALWGVDGAGSADGEIILSGFSPTATMLRLSAPLAVAGEWDTPADVANPDPPPPLHTLVVLEPPGPLSASVMSALPPTLTRLALLRVPQVGLHKLPVQLPLIEVLDLSFNEWLVMPSETAHAIEWRKWVHLHVLGLRGCGISEQDAKSFEAKVNRGRLKDVEIFFE